VIGRSLKPTRLKIPEYVHEEMHVNISASADFKTKILQPHTEFMTELIRKWL
jgi:hypothetical protein